MTNGSGSVGSCASRKFSFNNFGDKVPSKNPVNASTDTEELRQLR